MRRDAHARPVLAGDGDVLARLLPVLGVLGPLDVEAVGVDEHTLVAEGRELVARAHVGQHELALGVSGVGPVEQRAGGGRGHRRHLKSGTRLGGLACLRLDMRLPALLAQQLEVGDPRRALHRTTPPLLLGRLQKMLIKKSTRGPNPHATHRSPLLPPRSPSPRLPPRPSARPSPPSLPPAWRRHPPSACACGFLPSIRGSS